MIPKLKRIDLRKTAMNKESGGYHEHPDIKQGRQYLVKIDGDYYAGRFSRVWYGWNFDSWGTSGIQLDKPGTPSSMWQGCWEIVKAPR